MLPLPITKLKQVNMGGNLWAVSMEKKKKKKKDEAKDSLNIFWEGVGAKLARSS